MTSFLIACSAWLHSLATVVFIGHFVLLAVIYMPALETGGGAVISAISKRSRSWLYGSLVVFAITGGYLMLVNPAYLGLGNFGNLWSIAMLAKHVVVLVMIGIGFWYNAMLRVGPMTASNSGGAQAIANFRRYVNWMAACGVLVLLLTALAQAQP